MAKKVHRIHSLPDDAPWAGGLPPEGSPEHPLSIRALDRVLSLQRPVVLAHLRSVRLRQQDASTAEIDRVLERRKHTAITTGGAAVGATAVVPGIGTGVTLALSGVETVGFLETTTLFAQSIAEVHGVAIDDPDRARALVLTLMLGQEGVALVSQLAGEATGRGQNRAGYWGDLVTRTIPRAALGPVVDTLKSTFVRHFATRCGASIIGKALPFGIGAAIGGTGNHLLGRRVVTTSRKAFGAPPAMLPVELEPRAGARRTEHIVGGALGRAADGAAAITGSAERGVSKATERLRPRRELRIRENPAPDDDDSGRRP